MVATASVARGASGMSVRLAIRPPPLTTHGGSSGLRIALVSPYDYPFPGGVTEHIAFLMEHLERRGHHVQILAPSSASAETLAANHVYRLGSIVRAPYHGSWARITLSLGLGRKVRAILDRERFDVVHLHEPLLPVLPLTVLMHSRAANVGTFHASWERSRLYAVGRPLLEHAARRLHGRIAVSEAARHYVDRYFPGDYTIVPNGVDTTCFRPDLAPLPAMAGAGDDAPRVLFVGRLEKRKGLGYLLHAFVTVRRELPLARLFIAGAYGEPEQQHYKQLAHDLGLEGVVFLGRLSRSDLARAYASADVFCAPSIAGESFGIVLIEAMAAGAPVVCSDIDGYREVARHNTDAVLVPPRDPDALAAALVRLLRDGALRTQLSEAGLRRAAEFDWASVTARVEAFYLETVAVAAGAADTHRTVTDPLPAATRGATRPEHGSP